LNAKADYKPVIKTKRFDIFHQRIVRNPKLGLPRDVYSAWFHSDDVPRPICVVTIWKECPYLRNYVEWVEVTEDWRLEGVATEVLRALRCKLGKLSMDGGTKAGDAFVAAKDKFINAKVQTHARKKHSANGGIRNRSAKPGRIGKSRITNVRRKAAVAKRRGR
jgi:hypothetical protein